MKGTFRSYTKADGTVRFLCRVYRRDGKQYGATGATKREAEQKAIFKMWRARRAERMKAPTHNYSTSRTSG